jgi:hypothetical protein
MRVFSGQEGSIIINGGSQSLWMMSENERLLRTTTCLRNPCAIAKADGSKMTDQKATASPQKKKE